QTLPFEGSYQATNFGTLPSVPSGNYYLLLRIDDAVFIAESNELNNTMPIPLSLTTPDLATLQFDTDSTNIVFHPTRPMSPSTTVHGTVTNQGTGAANGFWYDRVYISTNATIDGAIDSQIFGISGPVAVGDIYQATNTISLPQQSGTYYLIFVADGFDNLYE